MLYRNGMNVWCDTYIIFIPQRRSPNKLIYRSNKNERNCCGIVLLYRTLCCYMLHTFIIFKKKRKRKIFYKIEITLMGNSSTAQKYGECVSMYLLHIIYQSKVVLWASSQFIITFFVVQQICWRKSFCSIEMKKKRNKNEVLLSFCGFCHL